MMSGSAVAGLGWAGRSHRSRKCCWQALRSVRVDRCHLVMKSWGVMGEQLLVVSG